MKRQAFIFYHKETGKQREEGKEKEIERRWVDSSFIFDLIPILNKWR